MSGGWLYVYNPDGAFEENLNAERSSWTNR